MTMTTNALLLEFHASTPYHYFEMRNWSWECECIMYVPAGGAKRADPYTHSPLESAGDSIKYPKLEGRESEMERL